MEETLGEIKEQNIGKFFGGIVTHLAEDAMDAHLAKNIGLEDSAGNFTATEIEGAMQELFTFANNGKMDIASVVGSPATSGNTFAQLKTHIQNAKTKGSTNLIAKGILANESETLDSIMTKIGQIETGKKATGTARVTSDIATFQMRNSINWSSSPSNSSYFEVRGLGFRPKAIVAYLKDGAGSLRWDGTMIYSESTIVGLPENNLILVIGFGASNPTRSQAIYEGESCIYDDGFRFPSMRGVTNSVEWEAIG